MELREYEADNLKECLQKVRSDLGPEAVILRTRALRKGGIAGLGGREAVRIVAATGVAVTDQAVVAPPGRQSDSAFVGGTPPAPAFRPWPEQGMATDPDRSSMVLTDVPPRIDEIARLQIVVQELRAAMLSFRHPDATPTTAVVSQQSTGKATSLRSTLVKRLSQQDMPADLAAQIVEAVAEPVGGSFADRERTALAALLEVMRARVACSGRIALTPGQAKVVALIGPTGVGKTTTIAKLAAHYALAEKKRVGLLTIDTYRIAAVEQLKTYAMIMDVPIAVAHTRAEIQPAVRAMAAMDLVLIDTAGRSQKNAMQMGELKALVEAVPCETHLVLAAGTKLSDLLDHIDRFRKVRVDRLIFSKVDETTSGGTMYSAAARCGIPASYLTTGQRVPDDIEVATPTRLAGLALGG